MEEVERQRAEAAKKKAAEVVTVVWSPDELSMLAKGLARYPAGVRERWRLVSELIGTKTVAEVIAKTSEAKSDRPAGMTRVETERKRKRKRKRVCMCVLNCI
jgi:hypothetical protein